VGSDLVDQSASQSCLLLLLEEPHGDAALRQQHSRGCRYRFFDTGIEDGTNTVFVTFGDDLAVSEETVETITQADRDMIGRGNACSRLEQCSMRPDIWIQRSVSRIDCSQQTRGLYGYSAVQAAG
jgi:hypothetical protein